MEATSISYSLFQLFEYKRNLKTNKAKTNSSPKPAIGTID